MAPSIATLARATRVGLSAARTSELDRRARADQRAMALLAAALLEQADTAIHIGSTDAELLPHLLAAAPAGRHLAIDAIPERALALRAALPRQVAVEEYALADDDAEGEMEVLHIDRSAHRDGPRPRDVPEAPAVRRLRVPSTSLDTLVERHELAPKLIRIEARGTEGLVLTGARRTIAAHQPALLVAHRSDPTSLGESSSAFFHRASDLGLRVYDLDGEGPYNHDAFHRAVAGRGMTNFLLRA